MKVALFTLTKDRLEYTKRTFESLTKKTHVSYDHFILDQNSKDGTVKWLEQFTHQLGKCYVYPLTLNIGINRGVNFIIEKIGKEYDIIVKIDNDVEIKTDGWLQKCLSVLDKKMLISPFVKGLIDNREGVGRIGLDKKKLVGWTSFIGGICMIGFRRAWSEDSGGWEFPVPKHAGGDRSFCKKLSLVGYRFGYKEDVVIRHIDTTAGQREKYKGYFSLRKQERVNII